MSFSLSMLLAWRLISSTSSMTIRTMIGVCCLSIFIGTFSLALIACVMRGFEHETHKKLQSIYPSIMIKAPDNSTLAYTALTEHIHKNLHGLITACSPYVIKPALVHQATTEEPTYVVTLKGIDPRYEGAVTALEHMTQPSTTLHHLKMQQVIIGKDLAHSLQVTIGDQLVLLCNEHDDTNFQDAHLISVPVTIAGIVTTGIADYDEHLILVHIGLCKKIWGTECVTHLGISLPTPTHEKKVLTELQKIPDIEAFSWKKLYPALVSSLALEQYVMFFLLLLITLVASMNIISLLFMYITYKRTDIALLKMLGMHNKYITALFLCISLIVTATAASAGLLIAYGVGRFLQWYPLIKLPTDVYYVTHLPVKLEGWLFLLVFACVIALSIGAAFLPIRTIRKLNITNTIRFE